jgi:hypothetical protein
MLRRRFALWSGAPVAWDYLVRNHRSFKPIDAVVLPFILG